MCVCTACQTRNGTALNKCNDDMPKELVKKAHAKDARSIVFLVIYLGIIVNYGGI